MIFAVVGIVFLLALFIGTISYEYLPYFDTEKNSDVEKDSRTLTTAITMVLKNSNWKRLLLLFTSGFLNAFCAYQLYIAEVDMFNLFRYLIVALLLISVMIIDGKTHIIPNILNGILFGVGIVFLVIEFAIFRETFVGTLIMKVLGLLGCFVLFYVLTRLIKDGIGMGDVKLIAAMGWVIGISETLITILFALILCTVVAIILLLGKKKDKKDQIPFGPFVFFGYILMLLLFSF